MIAMEYFSLLSLSMKFTQAEALGGVARKMDRLKKARHLAGAGEGPSSLAASGPGLAGQ